jgi:DNA polymerase-3 subunit delta
MAVLKEDDFENFLRRRLGSFSALLIHGDDEAVIASMANQAIAAFAKSEIAASLVDELDAAVCKKAPGIFADALNAMSLLGDKRLLLLNGVDDSCLEFLKPALDQPPGGNFAVLKAQALKKDSSLRVGFEAGDNAAVVAVFPDDVRMAASRARSILQASGLSWGEGAETAFFDHVGFDRPIVAQELNKLTLYCHGSSIVELRDVNAICGDLAEETLDDVIDAILSGELSSLDRGLSSATGKDASALLPLLSLHLGRLVAMGSAISEGQTVENAIRSARPPVFFKRKAAVANQLNRLNLNDLVKLQTTVQSLILKSRQLGDVSDAAVSRSLLSLSRNLRQSAR